MKSTILKASILTLLVGSFVIPSATLLADDAPTTAPSTQPEQTANARGQDKFYGVISAVDATAKTFTIDDQTYAITGDTAMTKAADGSAATMTDVTVGQTARGSFHKAHDGTMNVTKVRFGKKKGGGKGGKGGKKHKSATSQPDADPSSN